MITNINGSLVPHMCVVSIMTTFNTLFTSSKLHCKNQLPLNLPSVPHHYFRVFLMIVSNYGEMEVEREMKQKNLTPSDVNCKYSEK